MTVSSSWVNLLVTPPDFYKTKETVTFSRLNLPQACIKSNTANLPALSFCRLPFAVYRLPLAFYRHTELPTVTQLHSFMSCAVLCCCCCCYCCSIANGHIGRPPKTQFLAIFPSFQFPFLAPSFPISRLALADRLESCVNALSLFILRAPFLFFIFIYLFFIFFHNQIFATVVHCFTRLLSHMRTFQSFQRNSQSGCRSATVWLWPSKWKNFLLATGISTVYTHHQVYI